MIPAFLSADKRVQNKIASDLDKFVYNYEPVDGDRTWRKDLKAVLEETRIKENIRLRTIFQEYISFIPENHIEDLINKLK